MSATSGGVSIISFITVNRAPAGIASACFTLIFSLTTGIIKKLLSVTRNKKKKHDKILMLAKSKQNSIETLVFQAVNDMEIKHEEFIRILNEKDKYAKMKENFKNVNEKLKEKTENIRLDSVSSRTWKNISLFCVYTMFDIAVEKYADFKVYTIRVDNKKLFG